MTNGEVIARIQSLYSKGIPSDDSRLDDMHIYNVASTVRSRLLRQMINKKQLISDFDYQTIHCIEMIKVNPNECGCVPIKGCEIKRSKYKLPSILTNLDRHMIHSVNNLVNTITYSYSTWLENRYASGNKYTKAKPRYFIRDGYLYITSIDVPKIIMITALFADPIEAHMFDGFCDNEDMCTSYYDLEFPLDHSRIDTLIQMAANELINVFTQMIEDQSNNTKDTEDERAK